MNTPTIDAEKLTGITLAKGGHANPAAGLCLMEAVAYVRGIRHTDRPGCVAPVLGDMGRGLNDVLPDDLRQELIPLIPDLPGTAGDGHDEQRGSIGRMIAQSSVSRGEIERMLLAYQAELAAIEEGGPPRAGGAR